MPLRPGPWLHAMRPCVQLARVQMPVFIIAFSDGAVGLAIIIVLLYLSVCGSLAAYVATRHDERCVPP